MTDHNPTLILALKISYFGPVVIVSIVANYGYGAMKRLKKPVRHSAKAFAEYRTYVEWSIAFYCPLYQNALPLGEELCRRIMKFARKSILHDSTFS